MLWTISVHNAPGSDGDFLAIASWKFNSSWPAATRWRWEIRACNVEGHAVAAKPQDLACRRRGLAASARRPCTSTSAPEFPVAAQAAQFKAHPGEVSGGGDLHSGAALRPSPNPAAGLSPRRGTGRGSGRVRCWRTMRPAPGLESGRVVVGFEHRPPDCRLGRLLHRSMTWWCGVLAGSNRCGLQIRVALEGADRTTRSAVRRALRASYSTDPRIDALARDSPGSR